MKPEVMFTDGKGRHVLYMPIPGPQPCPAVGAGYRRTPSAEMAKRRLLHIIRADREAAQEGRWVKVRDRPITVSQLRGLGAFLFQNPDAIKFLITDAVRLAGARYRWEPRR